MAATHEHFAAIGPNWREQDDALRVAARHIGFRPCGSIIRTAFKSIINSALRRGHLERDGSNIRRISLGGRAHYPAAFSTRPTITT